MNKKIIALKWLGHYSKRIIPNFLYRFFTKMASAFITPLHFSWSTGHFKSSWLKKSVSSQNEPIPWYTYPLIEFLEHRDFSDKTVLEIGGGYSSFWWAKKAKEVITFEGNKEWFQLLRDKNKFSNLQIEFIETESQDLIKSLEEKIAQISIKQFDVVIIDGMDRNRIAQHCLPLLKEEGIIIVDDSDRYDFTKIFEENNFSKIDFYGYSPGVILPKCSSIQFKQNSSFFSNQIPVKTEQGKAKEAEVSDQRGRKNKEKSR